MGCPIRRSRDQRSLASPPGFSQRATSFIASQCQGIHQMPFSSRLSSTPNDRSGTRRRDREPEGSRTRRRRPSSYRQVRHSLHFEDTFRTRPRARPRPAPAPRQLIARAAPRPNRSRTPENMSASVTTRFFTLQSAIPAGTPPPKGRVPAKLSYPLAEYSGDRRSRR